MVVDAVDVAFLAATAAAANVVVADVAGAQVVVGIVVDLPANGWETLDWAKSLARRNWHG